MELDFAIIAAVSVGYAVLSCLTFLFHLSRARILRRLVQFAVHGELSRGLLFHSPDDAPKHFEQTGCVKTLFGQSLIYAWAGMLSLGYIYIMAFCWLSYKPALYMPAVFADADALKRPWLFVYIVTHVVAGAVSQFREALKTYFMMPVASMSAATHVIIRDNSLLDSHLCVDPDEELLGVTCMIRLQRRIQRIESAFRRQSQAALLVVQEVKGVRYIEYTCVRYVYEEAADSFIPVGLKPVTPAEAHQTLKSGGLSKEEAAEMAETHGKNEIRVHVPGVAEALAREFCQFTYVFNSLGVWAYVIVRCWNIALVWLAITLGSGLTRALCIVRPNERRVADMARMSSHAHVFRSGRWIRVEAADIVLGDVVNIDGESAQLPCDGVIIDGSVVVDESMLTGEPMPIQKLPVDPSQGSAADRGNTAFAGTTVLQSIGQHNGKAVMLATAVGALTTRGQLVRMVLFPAAVRFKYNDQLPVVYFLMVLWMCLLMLVYYLFCDMGSFVANALMVVCTVAKCLNPMMPVSMIMGQTSAVRRLGGILAISCLEPGRIPIAGKVSTMVFDKTGTITKEGMDFVGVVSIVAGTFGAREELIDRASSLQNWQFIKDNLPPCFGHALACCHTVTTLLDGTLVGNHVEVAMVRMAGWSLGRDELTSPLGDETLEVLRLLEFDHCRMTSGVVVRSRETGHIEVFVKGSYEKMAQLCSSDSVPGSYDKVTGRYAKEGCYTLGLAVKSLSSETTQQQLVDMSRDQLENGLEMCGLLLFRNEMKTDSPCAIKKLRDGGVRSLMCTGDNALTAISIGRMCGILRDDQVLLGDVDKHQGLFWVDIDDMDADETLGASDLDKCSQLAVTQSAWKHLLEHPKLLHQLWRRIFVFARMKPEDKISVVKHLQACKLVVGMCGDGGNDCGALRAAHAGLALSAAEASIVSPFSSGRDGKSLLTVVDLIREGRACLATNLATFQFYMTYALTLTTLKTGMVVVAGLSMGEYVWITMDLFVGVLMVWTMTHSEAADDLATYRPTATLLGARTISAILFPYLTACFAQAVAFAVLWRQEWYTRLNPTKDIHVQAVDWMKKGDNYDAAATMFPLVLALANTAYVNTYGGVFRRDIRRNVGINLTYAVLLLGLYFLCFSSPNRLNAVFRVNCDMAASLDASNIPFVGPVLTWCSEGGTGGCFLAPQVKVWQDLMPQPQDEKGAVSYWQPSKDNGCLPDQHVLTQVPIQSPDISTNGCYGPNNCFSPEYKAVMAAIMTVYIVVNHWFARFVLLGPVAAALRRTTTRRPVQVEMITERWGEVDTDGDKVV